MRTFTLRENRRDRGVLDYLYDVVEKGKVVANTPSNLFDEIREVLILNKTITKRESIEIIKES